MPAACSRPDFPRSLYHEETMAPMSQSIYSRRATLLQGFIVSLLFILIGAVAGAFCLNFYAARKHVLDHGLRTEATVVKLIRDYHPGSRATSYTPVVSFTDAQGKSRQITRHLGDSDFHDLKPGTRTQIAYLPEAPEHFEIIPAPKMKVLLLIASGGGLFFVVGIGMLITTICHCFKKR